MSTERYVKCDECGRYVKVIDGKLGRHSADPKAWHIPCEGTGSSSFDSETEHLVETTYGAPLAKL